MSTDPETTRIVRSWLDEGVTRLPDRVLDAVLDQVPATRQRRATWWPARRLSAMNTTTRFGLAAAVLAVAALLGINVLGNGFGIGGPGPQGPTPTAEPTPTPTAEPTPTSTPEGLLPEGPHVLTDGEDFDGQPTLRTTVAIQAPDWYGEPGGGILTKHDNPNGPGGAGMIVFFGEFNVYRSPCNWSTTRPNEPADTVDEVVDALALQVTRNASEPIEITLDGYAGKAITLHVPDDAVFGECDQGVFGSWGMPGPDRTPVRYHQSPGQIDEVWVVDVDGTIAIIDWAYYDGTPQATVDEMRAIVESITFGD